MAIATYHIHLEGKVQGVGFRPFVYKLALEYGLKGWVINGPDGVHIEVDADENTFSRFYRDLLHRAPDISYIQRHSYQQVPPNFFPDFRIRESDEEGNRTLLLTPDLDMCPACRAEMYDPADRRFGYAFLTCTYCGPRYSLIRRLPYDRPTTTMAPFRMCPECQAEYDNPLDRRYYSQTNSCAVCGIRLQLLTASGEVLAEEQDAIIQAVEQLAAGAILAIKGIGGYLLLADAANREVLLRLRQRKHRPSKPFAVMFPDIESVEQALHLSPASRKALLSREKPIVLLPMKADASRQLAIREIAPQLDQLGVMLPYTPLFDQLLTRIGRPVVATSGNLSGSPVLFRDEEALDGLKDIADLLLVNNREITVPQDDSVLRFTPRGEQQIVIRRSRSFAPTYIAPQAPVFKSGTLAMGAMLKGCFAFAHAGNTYISPYLGDLQSFEAEEMYRHSLHHLLKVLDARPQVILVDSHPDYFSTRYGQQLAREEKLPLQPVQHHRAHFAAVLAENGLQSRKNPVLGVIWDGTGYGDDGQIWGGEFFLWQGNEMRRVAHVPYYPHIAGDKMALEPRMPALALAYGHPGVVRRMQIRFTPEEWRIYQTLLQRPARLQTSSMGRIFDAVACWLDLGDQNSYEGESALRLEQLARRYWEQRGSLPKGYTLLKGDDTGLSGLLDAIGKDLDAQADPGKIALSFHVGLVNAIDRVAKKWGADALAFSGGVFQNALLVDLLHERLAGYERYFHLQLSPNDENIPYGQLAYDFLRKNS